jgi:hypothetical protein
MSEIPEGCTCSDCHPFSSHQIENEALEARVLSLMTRCNNADELIEELKNDLRLREATIKSLRSRLDGENEDRRFTLTVSALAGLVSYCGNSPLNATNAVRLADQTIAALEAKPASND